MVVEKKVNQVVDSVEGSPAPQERWGFELPLLLFAGFRSLIDQLHAELADHGYGELRPAHGFALQAVGREGVSASELGRRLGVSKQAAGKTVDRLAALGFVKRTSDQADARRKLVRLTPRGQDALTLSAAVFQELRGQWADRLGPRRLEELEDALESVVGPAAFRLDAAGWFGD